MAEEKRFPIGPGPEQKRTPGLGSLLKGLFKRTSQGRSPTINDREDITEEDKPFKFDASQFMIDKFTEEGVQPEILGEGFQGNTPILIIRTPNFGTMSISLEDFIKNFGKPPMKFKGIERGADDSPYRFAQGGRVEYQTGGITEIRELPPEFIEAAQKTFLTDLSRQAGIPSITTATTQQPGETAEQFANRQAQAQQFQITKAGMAELAPQVAKQDALQAAARTQAVDPTTGLGSFQPFLTKATTAVDAAAGLTGPMTAAQTTAYTSPFQQQVIDATREEFDKQAQIRRNELAASALRTPGAFGGGREGVQRAEFDAASDANRARILADLRQRGFQQAQTARQQDIANQLGIAQLQSGLGGSAQDFARAQIAGLGTLGAQEQAQQQAILDANRQAAAMAVQDPRDRLGMFGTGIAQITPGAGGVTLQPTAATAPAASPLMTALGVGLAGADIYGRIFGPRKS